MLGLYSVAAIVYLNLGKSCWRSQSMMEIWVFKNEEARIPAGVGYDFFISGQIWESFLGKLLLVDCEKCYYFLMNGWLEPLMVHISYF